MFVLLPRLRALLLLSLSLLVGACAAWREPRPDHLLDDTRFAPPTERISADDVFALSDAMRVYARTEIAELQREHGRRRGLFVALYRKSHLKLEYDSAVTRTASEAFAARSGNCLSLVIMTAAFAKAAGLAVHYQSATSDTPWSRNADFFVRSGHINVSLGDIYTDRRYLFDPPLMIDFLPPEDLRGLKTRPIGEKTVLAMFMNNRASEALMQGRLDDAYWWARGAVDHDPGFVKTYNTLGVIYQRHGDAARAEMAFRHALVREPRNEATLANIAWLLRQNGRVAEAAVYEDKLAFWERATPFREFDLGLQAMQRGDFRGARNHFAREIERDPYNHEFHFWLALADWRLGDGDRARAQLVQAMETSTTRVDRDRYAAKLEWLKAQQ